VITVSVVKHPHFDLSAQTFLGLQGGRVVRGAEQGEMGSAYLIGPGTFLTALHCVIPGNTVPDEKVTCEIRLYQDIWSSTAENTKWKFQPATLVWPPAGTCVDDIDIAVLVVDEKNRTPAMKQEISISTHIPESEVYAGAVGYPAWRGGKPRRIPGLLEANQSKDALHDFDVEGATPEKEDEWRTASGSVLFARGTNVCLGVVSTRSKSKENCLLGATLFHHVVAKKDFWAKTGLPEPSTEDVALQLAARKQESSKSMRPSRFLYLFDRTPQHNSWRFFVRNLANPFPTLIVPVIAGLEDEASYLIRRLETVLEEKFEERKTTYLNSDTVNWVVDDVDAEEAVEQMLYLIQGHLRIEAQLDLRDFSKSCASFREAIESGTAPRAFRIEMAIEDDEERIISILKLLFERMAMLGNFDSPLVLFLSIDKTKLATLGPERPPEQPRIKKLQELVKKFAVMSWLPLAPLGLCSSTDIDKWSTELERLRNPLLDLTSLSPVKILTAIHDDENQFNQPFSFQRARVALDKLEL
jgi:hypothetical protein